MLLFALFYVLIFLPRHQFLEDSITFFLFFIFLLPLYLGFIVLSLYSFCITGLEPATEYEWMNEYLHILKFDSLI